MRPLSRTRLAVSAATAVRTYAVARPNPRPKDPVLTSPNAKVQQIAPDVTFIHNPPASVPTPYSLTTAPTSPLLVKRSSQTEPVPLAPELHPAKRTGGPKLTQAQIEEIRQLRHADPKTNSCQALARRFGCSPLFVSMAAPLKKEEREELAKDKKALQESWGERKQLTRAIREKRREYW
ncbi:ribosomal protein subunit L20 [Ceratobasidium sp. AG-Ba]|nr:ribosomal protein subunit L20 [Ceratobasidium sp. AG-Ba]QRW14552.1 ribosomal protein subunit L20 [Ceratobasidium sp. AG-Ba]